MRRHYRKNFGRIISALLATFFIPSMQCRAEIAVPKPQVKIEAPIFDFGTVAQGVRVTHNFNIKNVGTSDLMIHRVVPGCGCTAASASGDVIAAGKEGAIKVDLDTANFSGENLKLIRVFTNDTDNPSTTLTLKGKIESNVRIEPARVTFNNVVRGTAAGTESREVKITVTPESGMEIDEVKSFSKYVAVKMLKNTAQSAAFSVSLDATAPVGELRDRLVVNFKGAKPMSLNVPVFANIEGSLRLSPNSISFGILEGDAPIERSVKFENLGGKPIALKEVSSNDPAVSVEYAVIKEGTNYVVHVKLDPKKVTRDLRALVTVKTDSATEAPLTLNVFGILPPKG